MNASILGREEVLLNSLLRFYNPDPPNNQNLNILAAVSKQKTIISLREMDFTVTNYSNNNKVSYKLKNGETFNMYLDYKSQLRGYSKRLLDPFCRRQRIYLDFATKTPIFLQDSEIAEYKNSEDGIVTTIGQLNFFRWAITNEVIDYCFTHKEEIDREMDQQDKNKTAKKAELKKDKDKSQEDTIKVIIQFP